MSVTYYRMTADHFDLLLWLGVWTPAEHTAFSRELLREFRAAMREQAERN